MQTSDSFNTIDLLADHIACQWRFRKIIQIELQFEHLWYLLLGSDGKVELQQLTRFHLSLLLIDIQTICLIVPKVVYLHHRQILYLQISHRFSPDLCIVHIKSVVHLLLEYAFAIKLIQNDLSTIGSSLEHDLDLFFVALVWFVSNCLLEHAFGGGGELQLDCLLGALLEVYSGWGYRKETSPQAVLPLLTSQ
jgi:hypothetical protein